MKIRSIQSADKEAVDQLIYQSFSQSEHGYGNEVELVHAIRRSPNYRSTLELVAIQDQHIVGYGLLSEATIEQTLGVVLAPLAVLPNYQKQGIGQSLLTELEQRARKNHYAFLSILGDPHYYTTFGYFPASQFSISAPFEVPEEAFMIKKLQTSPLPTGTLIYSNAFNEVIE